VKLQGKQFFSRRLRLVPLSFDHVDAVLEWANDPAVVGNSQFFREHSDRRRIARFILEHEDDESCAYFAAFVRDDVPGSELGYVGNVFLININRNHAHCQAGITLKQAAWNRGYAKELMSAILRFAFDDLGMNKVYIQLFTSNEKGLRLWTKMGFQVEGTLRAHYLLDGTFHDMVSLSLLGAEWRG
jgi:RimJ/RimL family protein N-acetyltransferase